MTDKMKIAKWMPVYFKDGCFLESQCSLCHSAPPAYELGEYLTYYCPNCGAFMMNGESYEDTSKIAKKIRKSDEINYKNV